MNHFFQKTLFGKREIKVYESKFSYTIFNYGNVNEFNVPFEKLTNDKFSQKKTEAAYILVSVILYALGITSLATLNVNYKTDDLLIIIVMLSGATASLILFFWVKQNLWKILLTDGTILTIYKKFLIKSALINFIVNLLPHVINTYEKSIIAKYMLILLWLTNFIT